MARDVFLVLLIFSIVHLQYVCGSLVCDNQVVELEATKEQKQLDFPGNQNVTNNVYHCQWRLIAEEKDYTIQVVMQSVVINHGSNCSMSSLSLYDGHDSTDYLLRQECSNRTENMVVNSSNENVYIVWLLPAGLTNSNTFTIAYAARDNGGKTHNFTKTSHAGVIAAIILVIVFTLSIVMAVVCFFRNRAKMERRNVRQQDSYIRQR
ncbi:uncharacterized protein LOC132544048 [Ylistrum balloti]|uniref:uncharacterized protein LOC132544048 n=1 Tax=Ylistrum balloti TaxID=509963 RepID=UPI0029059EF9|nr:uncharacterized protein LOC132544048 [Ylistrum balloti]